MRHKAQRDDDGAVRERMKALAHELRRFDYRRLHVLLRREGFTVNHKRLFRLYREERLRAIACDTVLRPMIMAAAID